MEEKICCFCKDKFETKGSLQGCLCQKCVDEASQGFLEASVETFVNALNEVTLTGDNMKNITQEEIRELLDNTPDYVQGWRLPNGAILNTKKYITDDGAIFDAFPEYKRLMIGVINWYGGGWIHIDIDNHTLSKKNAPDFVPLDLCCDAKSLPFEDSSIGQVCAASMLEHVSHKEIDLYLKEWYRVLYEGARLDIIVPDVFRLFINYCHSNFYVVDYERDPYYSIAYKKNSDLLGKQEKLFRIVYGGQDFSGDFHKCGFTKGTLYNRLNNIGFVDIKEVLYSSDNFWMTARK